MIDAPETALLERREPFVGLEPEARMSVSFQNQSAERTSGDIRESSRVIWPMGCLHQIFEAQSSVRGDAPAVVCDGLVLSYSEVEAASNRLARQLRSAGAGRGSLIGLCLNRSERPIIAILACLKAGAAYVPIDPAHPDDRVRYIIEEAEVSVVICEDALVDRIRPVFDGAIVSLDSDAAEIAAQSAERLTRKRIRRHSRRSLLRHLYVGDDRAPEGRHDRAPQRLSLCPGVQRGLRDDVIRSCLSGLFAGL